MLKRICLIFCIVVIVSFSVIPAFALSEGDGDYENIFSTTFRIDSVQNSYGDVFPWPNNEASFGSNLEDTFGTFDFNDMGFYGSVRNHCEAESVSEYFGSLNTEFTLYDGGVKDDSRALRFSSDLMLLKNDASFTLMVSENDILLYQVVMEFNVVQLVKNANGVGFNTSTTYVKDSVDANFYTVHPHVDLAKVARYLVCKNVEIDNDEVFLLADVCIEVRYTHLSDSTPYFLAVATMQKGSVSPSTYLYNWVNDNYIYFPKPIAPSTADADFVTWMVRAVGAFLSFEIAPGLSVNSILYVFLIIGLLLWFLKIIS